MIKKILSCLKIIFKCIKKDEIGNLIKIILYFDSYNINHLKLIKLDKKIVNNNDNLEKTINQILIIQKKLQNLKSNLKSIYLYLHLINKINYNKNLYFFIDNIKFENYLKIKINNSLKLKYSILQKGLFIFLKKINKESELFLYIIQNSNYEIKDKSIFNNISLFLKIYDLNLFQILNQYLINPFNILNKDNKFKEVKDYYNLIWKIIRKIFKFLKNNINWFIKEIYDISFLEAILCYEIYSEFISINKIFEDYYNIINKENIIEYNIPNKINYEIDIKENKKIEKYIYKIKNENQYLKEISLFYYLECSLKIFINKNIKNIELKNEFHDNFLNKNSIIINFINNKQNRLKNNIKELKIKIDIKNNNTTPINSKSNKINTSFFNSSTRKINKLNNNELYDTTNKLYKKNKN